MKKQTEFKLIPMRMGAVLAVMARGGSALLAAVSSILQARVLGPTGKGYMALILTVSTLAVTFSKLSLDGALTHHSAKRAEEPHVVVGTGLLLWIFFSTLAAGVLWFLTPWLGRTVFKSPDALWIYIPIVAVPLLLLISFGNGLVLGFQKITWSLGLEVCRAIFFPLLLAVFFLCGWTTVMGAASAYLLSLVITVALLCVLIRSWDAFKGLNFSMPLARSLLSFGARWYVAAILGFLNYRIQLFLLSYYTGANGVGLYTISLLMVEWMWIIPGAVGYVIFPRVSASNDSQSSATSARACRHGMIWLSASCVFLFLFARPIIGMIFGPSFSGAATPALILAPGAAAFGLWKVLANDIAGRGKPHFEIYSLSLACAATVVIGVAAIPVMGITGAALANSVAYGLASLVILYFFQRETRLPLSQILIPKMDDFKEYGRLVQKLKHDREVLKG